MKMSTKRWALLPLALALSVAGCGVPVQSGAHFASTFEPGRRATFDWDDEADHTQGDARLSENSFFHARLHEAVEWELNVRGIRRAESNPELVIHHHLSLSDHEMEREVVDDSGMRSQETVIYEGASVVLHIVDARTGQDRWVAWAQANVEPALVSPDAMRKWVYSLVGKMFTSWPMLPRSGEE